MIFKKTNFRLANRRVFRYAGARTVKLSERSAAGLLCYISEGFARGSCPVFVQDGAQWLAEKKVKKIVIDDFTGILVANGVETARTNHDILLALGVEILIMEFPSGVEQLTRKGFFVMALPVKFEGIDSIWTRAIAIEER